MRDRRALTRLALATVVVAGVVVAVRKRSRRADDEVPADVRTAIDEGVAAAGVASPDAAEWIPVTPPDQTDGGTEADGVPADGAGLVAPA
ncbi:MAG TPA: hypothetical protein VFO60_07495 [Candidatus Dormibacteraeota bacterium]|nr:hypothetical protein [Candidatus Dormibacteraeota bacterium]